MPFPFIKADILNVTSKEEYRGTNKTEASLNAQVKERQIAIMLNTKCDDQVKHETRIQQNTCFKIKKLNASNDFSVRSCAKTDESQILQND